MENNNKKQQLLLEYMVSSPDTFALCKSITKPEYFDPDYRRTVQFLHQFYDKYNAVPAPNVVEAETGLVLKKIEMSRADVKYSASEIEAFCQRRGLLAAIYAAPKHIDAGEYGTVERMIKDAIAISLNRDMGLSYFEAPMERLEKMAATPQRTPTKWKAVDKLMNGGLARTEMMLFSANSGGGKSITLANLGYNFLTQPKEPGKPEKMNVLYISLELSEEMIAQRYDMMYTGVSPAIWQHKYKQIGMTLNELSPHLGELTIKRMPSGATANMIRSYIKEFELTRGYVPDLLIVDYLDIMGSNEHVSADNVSEKDKRAAEQLRDIGFEFNMFVATASQQNRSAIEATDLNHSHIAGGLTKINTVDWYLSIVMTPAMKAAGEIGFKFLKSRSSDAVGQYCVLKWDGEHLRVTNMAAQDADDDGVIEPQSESTLLRGKGSLEDSFTI